MRLSSRSRLELMNKLAARENVGEKKPEATVPTIKPTPCILIKNAFDPAEETGDHWDKEIQEDVRDECNKYGQVVHIYVDKESQVRIGDINFFKGTHLCEIQFY
jgi:RNA-binding protein 39